MPLDYVKYPYQAVYPGDNEGIIFSRSISAYVYIHSPLEIVTADSIFSGITTFAKLPWVQCLTKGKEDSFDIAFLGAPFVGYVLWGWSSSLLSAMQDTGTSYRPGARFGPAGIRAGSRRLTLYGGYNVPLEVNPFQAGLKIVDCG
jgi:agmatinase